VDFVPEDVPSPRLRDTDRAIETARNELQEIEHVLNISAAHHPGIRGHESSQPRQAMLFGRGFDWPGDVETRLGYHVGQFLAQAACKKVRFWR
jgi:hypothetical protein